MTKDEVKALKQRRRTLKNRGYAHNCRNKRMLVKEDLELENGALRRTISELSRKLSSVTKERDTYKRHIQCHSRSNSSSPY